MSHRDHIKKQRGAPRRNAKRWSVVTRKRREPLGRKPYQDGTQGQEAQRKKKPTRLAGEPRFTLPLWLGIGGWLSAQAQFCALESVKNSRAAASLCQTPYQLDQSRANQLQNHGPNESRRHPFFFSSATQKLPALQGQVSIRCRITPNCQGTINQNPRTRRNHSDRAG